MPLSACLCVCVSRTDGPRRVMNTYARHCFVIALVLARLFHMRACVHIPAIRVHATCISMSAILHLALLLTYIYIQTGVLSVGGGRRRLYREG